MLSVGDTVEEASDSGFLDATPSLVVSLISDILDGIDEQILPSQGCEMPLESLIKSSLRNCAKDDECKVNLCINASCCKQIREVVEEKSDILRMINEQILPSQGCGRPLESSSNFAEQNK